MFILFSILFLLFIIYSMSFRDTVSKLGQTEPVTETYEPKYLFVGIFSHGGYGGPAKPYMANKHSSISVKTYHSVPKLMTFMNCSPGSSLLGENGGTDNVVLTEYFRRSGDFNILDVSDFFPRNVAKYKINTKDKLLSQNFLGYMNSALDELEMRPRNRTERFKTANPTDTDVCRNSFICDGKVGISHSFQNKSFSTDDRPIHANSGHNWGIFIYNNNCGVEPGTDIHNIDKIQRDVIENDDGYIIGIKYTLDDIVTGLTEEFNLTDKDYLFMFDYSCNNYSSKTINQSNDLRLTRRLGRSLTSDLGFGRKSTKKRRAKNKKQKKHKKTKKRNK
jgi:hypothetical protein